MILVTGAGGTVGSELVRQLREANIPFRAAFHTPEKAKKARDQGIDTVVLDFADPATVAPALEGIDRLFLLFGGGGGQTEKEINVVRVAKQKEVRRIVKLSVWGAAGEEFSFARIHRPVEREIEAAGMDFTHLRPNGFMQNFANFYGETIRTQGAFYLPAGEARISHVDVRDIAAVAVKTLSEGGHERSAYELSGPEALTYQQCAEKLSKAAERQIRYLPISDEDFRKGAIAAGIPAMYADALIDLNRYYKEGKGARVSPSVRQILGRDPNSFDRYVRDHAAAFR